MMQGGREEQEKEWGKGEKCHLKLVFNSGTAIRLFTSSQKYNRADYSTAKWHQAHFYNDDNLSAVQNIALLSVFLAGAKL